MGRSSPAVRFVACFQRTAPNCRSLDNAFDLADWPVTSEAAKNALQEMKSSHACQPLPAFDMHGNLIPPSDYEQALRGAVAHVRFSLCKYSWRTGDSYRDPVVADIEMLRVITPPRPRSRVAATRKRGLRADIYTPDFRPSARQRLG